MPYFGIPYFALYRILSLSGNKQEQDVEIKGFLRKKWVAYWQTYIIIN